MNLRLASGSVTPASPAQEIAARRPHGPAGCCRCCGTGDTTCSASPIRIRPWSTNTQVSCSPIASWISTAATALSTPPDSPQITLPVADLRADLGDLRVAITRPSSSRRRSRRRGARNWRSACRRRACGRPRGGTQSSRSGAPRRWRSRKARLRTSRRSEARRQSSSTLSPWLIHTWCFSPTFHSPSNNARVLGRSR